MRALQTPVASSRNIARIRRWLRAALVVLVFALGGALVSVIAMYASAWGTVPASHWSVLAQVGALFAIFGAMLGTIMSLDRSATPTPLPRWLAVPFNAPVLRTAICSALGLAAVLVVSSWHAVALSGAWLAAGAIAGAALAWLG